MKFYIRENRILKTEIEDLIIADLALTVAFALVLVGGIENISQTLPSFIYFLPISFIAVSLSFVLHELMHKFIAERYGAIAGFRTSINGLAITLLTSLFGFLIGIPGATVIYASNFTKREEGIVSLAGPLTNFAVFSVFFMIGIFIFPNFLGNVTTSFSSNYYELPPLQNLINISVFISILLAFFNMLPIYPLDGSKVLRWNKTIFFSVILVIFLLFSFVIPIISILIGMIFMLAIAYIFSLFYRGLF
ncbi:MAG: site-2 protease family protein [Candidatus Micrarchaeia archaeon]